MKKLLLMIMLIMCLSSMAFAHSVRSKGVGADLVFYSALTQEVICTMSAAEAGMEIPNLFADDQSVSPNTSVTTSMTANDLLVYNGATVGTANVVLPSSPGDGQVASITTLPAITVATITGRTKTVNAGATSFSANTSIAYIFSSVTDEWHKYK